MDSYSIDIEEVFITHLEKKGIGEELIHTFIRDLVNSNFEDPNISLLQVCSHLTLLGWQDSIVDYHTLQLAKAYLENCSIMS